ncbi:MAG TPA: peptide chain release factor N(5)-glutamine methyltransferase [Candidatus Acidoferrales bacterium]|nr:peptide chain release factor N(5)-glutamine methyltransferase [Candidatus Acidoferrales bacterium]
MNERNKSVIAPAGDIRSALKEGMARLRAAQIPSHTLAAEVLLEHTLGRDRAWVYTHSEAQMDPATWEKFFALVARRVAGEPTQYLTGRQEFWGLTFEVTPDVLIPRPETEHVVEVALERLGSRGISIDTATGTPSTTFQVADVGTGSGCLAVVLARELPHSVVFASDISALALEVARRNAARHGVLHRVRFLETDLLEGLVREFRPPSCLFDLIVSNPPYIARDDVSLLAREVRDHEPEAALVGGERGVETYARLIEQAAQLLAPEGILVVELGYGAADRVQAMLQAETGWVNIRTTDDLAGIPRVLAAEHV